MPASHPLPPIYNPSLSYLQPLTLTLLSTTPHHPIYNPSPSYLQPLTPTLVSTTPHPPIYNPSPSPPINNPSPPYLQPLTLTSPSTTPHPHPPIYNPSPSPPLSTTPFPSYLPTPCGSNLMSSGTTPIPYRLSVCLSTLTQTHRPLFASPTPVHRISLHPFPSFPACLPPAHLFFSSL
ncbi:hypothetical protein Pcinc_027241 [Petrolisthes cinctipes]|uniref:Uncharacterized protein n=1 Tax=Petrolisthes cinctipes TaxID=88211 RepID=A0AAE1K720_PETCI|nr:hypothetical protein Pcinc_027241 [Petrolisthes cinctipes]